MSEKEQNREKLMAALEAAETKKMKKEAAEAAQKLKKERQLNKLKDAESRLYPEKLRLSRSLTINKEGAIAKRTSGVMSVDALRTVSSLDWIDPPLADLDALAFLVENDVLAVLQPAQLFLDLLRDGYLQLAADLRVT